MEEACVKRSVRERERDDCVPSVRATPQCFSHGDMTSSSCLVGLDEAGCGPGFGSLWAAAVHLRPGAPLPQGLRDSKRMTEAQRWRVREALLDAESGCQYGLGEVTSAEVDALGLGECRRLVFERALDDFVARNARTPTELIVDGTLFRAWRGVPHRCVPRADATVPCVMAASVVAKTTRDAQVVALCDADPTLDARYQIRSNKGYLSAAHLSGLRTYGHSEHHRRSYRIKGLLSSVPSVPPDP